MTQEPSFGLGRIGQIAVNVKDLARATAFYRDTLGMRLLFEVPKMAFFDCDGVRLMLAVPEKPEFDHPSSILYFRVGDIHRKHAVLVERGVEFLIKPHIVTPLGSHDLWMTFFRDTEGNTHALMAEIAREREHP